MSKPTILALLLFSCLMPATAFGAVAPEADKESVGTLTIAGHEVLRVGAVAEYSADERVRDIWKRMARSLMQTKRTGNSLKLWTVQPYNAERDVVAQVRQGRSALMFHGSSIALATPGEAAIMKMPVEAVAGIWAQNLKVALRAMNATGKTPFNQVLAKMAVVVDGRKVPMDNSGLGLRFPE